MSAFLPTIILRHRKENLKKCSLSGLEGRSDMQFYTYPYSSPPSLENYIVLGFDGPPLSSNDAGCGLFLLDATWHYAATMAASIDMSRCPIRTLPHHYRTAYPRRQTACDNPDRGLASIEALYIAYSILERPLEGLLDQYHWKEPFLTINQLTINALR